MILHSIYRFPEDVVNAARDYAATLGCTSVQVQPYSPGRPAIAGAAPAAVVLIASGQDAATLVPEISRLSPPPLVLVPGSLANSALIDGLSREFARHLYFAFYPPTPPRNAALASARILVAALERAGQNLSRQSLIKELEGLYEFGTGLVPPVTYGPARRVGFSRQSIVIRGSTSLGRKATSPAPN